MDSKIKVDYRNKPTFQKLLIHAMNNNVDFKLREIGTSTYELLLPNARIKSKDSSNFRKGSHLSRMILLEIEKRINNGNYVPRNQDAERNVINTVMYDSDNILKNKHKPCVAIDINSCYWNTARNIGAISEYLYKKGMDGGQTYKISRNAAIGSLNALIKEYVPLDGELVLTNYFRRPYNVVRLDIIDRVWEIAVEIAKSLEDGFLFFLTDCFYVTADKQRIVTDKLKEFGYSSKKENIMIETVKGSNVMQVVWSTPTKDKKPYNFNTKQRVLWK